MNDSIVRLEEYKRDLENKKALDNKDITVYDLSVEELEGVSQLYNKELKEIYSEIKVRSDNVKRLEQENIRLRKLIKGGNNK